METLDNILSGRGEATSATPETPTPTTQETTQKEPTTEGQKPEVEGTEPEPEGATVGPDGQKMVPLAAVHAERQKGKRYTEQVASFEQTVSGLREQNTTLNRQVAELLARLPRQDQQPQEPPDFFVNPNEATLHTVAPHLQQLQQQLMAHARDYAELKFTSEKVNEAEQWFLSAAQNHTLEPADYHKVVNSPNRYAAAVQLYAAQERAKPDFEEKVRADERAKVLAESQQQNGIQPNGQQPPAVMPSNFAAVRNVGARTGPAWGGTAPLADIFNRHRSKE